MFVFRNFFSIVVFFITIVFVSACADNDSDIVNGVIMYDSSKIYPKLDVKLSDLADVSFIPLGGEDSINFLTSSVSITKNIYIDSTIIIVGDCSPSKDILSKSTKSIYFFQPSGKFIRSAGIWNKYPHSGKSYIFMSVLPLQEKVVTHTAFYEPGSMVAFSFNGEYEYLTELDKGYMSSVLNDKLVLYDRLYKYKKDPSFNIGRALSVYDLREGFFNDFKDLNPGDEELDSGIEPGFGMYSTSFRTYITSFRTDVVYALDTNYNITPVFKSVYKNPEHPDDHNIVYPLIETDEYILFCNRMDFQSEKAERYKYGIWIFLKSEQKIYQISDMGYMKVFAEMSSTFSEYSKKLLEGEIFVNNYNRTQNSDILVSVLDIDFLKENMDLLPEQLRPIVQTKTTGDNPVLMVMRFGKSLKEQL